MSRHMDKGRGWTVAIFAILAIAALWWALTPTDVYIRGCKYIHIYSSLTHAGDCPNPIHKETP